MRCRGVVGVLVASTLWFGCSSADDAGVKAPHPDPALGAAPTEQLPGTNGEQGDDPFFTADDSVGVPPSDAGAAPSGDAGLSGDASAPDAGAEVGAGGGADGGAGGGADVGVAEPPKKASAELLVGEAARQLSAMKVTSYQHPTEVDEATGTFRYDCSGFLGYALKRVLPDHLVAVRTFSGVTRPLAKHFQTFFAALPVDGTKSGWTGVARAGDLEPGDVIAWLKPPEQVSTNTGHVMIVRAKATPNPKRADEVLVLVIDASASPHGATDTRAPSGGGLGSGPVGLIVDGGGAPIRYRWTGGVSATEWTTAISLARPN
ncbi:MAG: hypothetical protein HYV09_36600 [Deltaproteobacteria bacterium]|nr:hypothetical protein [Deltaproteobacteria bacterium]